MTDQNTQLTSAYGYDTSNIIYSEPQLGNIPNANPNTPQLQYIRINIKTRNNDGTIGDLIVPSEDELFSFGVSENTSLDTGKVNGHQMSLCLWDRDSLTNKNVPTKSQKQFTDTIDQITESVKSYIIKNKHLLGKKYAKNDDMEFKVHLKKFNPLYWRKNDDGEILR